METSQQGIKMETLQNLQDKIVRLEAELRSAQADKERLASEVCICAAVKSDDGQVIRCHRHADGFRALEARKLKLLRTIDGQGFITSRGRYVNRTEGRALQDAAKIPSVDPRGYMPQGLCSEDLY
jgi:hypothetical protein